MRQVPGRRELDRTNARAVVHIFAILALASLLALQAETSNVPLGIVPVHGDPTPSPPGSTVETQWVPAGPASDKIVISVYSGQIPEYKALQGGTIDLTDVPMFPFQTPTFCAAGSTWWCVGTPPNPAMPACPHGQAYLKGWIDVAQGTSTCLSYFFALLNMWNSLNTPNVPPPPTGPTIRWGFQTGTNTLNPYLVTVPDEEYVLGEVYDTMFQVSPYVPLAGPQVFGWMPNQFLVVSHSTDPGCPAVIGATAVANCLKVTLRGDITFQDGTQVTASDVKFSYLSLLTNGASLGSCLGANNIFDVNFNPAVLPVPLGGVEAQGSSETMYIDFSAAPPANALLCLASVPVLPQFLWRTGAPGSPAPTAEVPCADASITMPGSNDAAPQCTLDPFFVSVAGSDPVANNRLIGSGPFVCAPGPYAVPSMTPPAGLGGGCTSTGTSVVPGGASITLQRFGSGLTPTSLGYFRDDANYRQFLWAAVDSMSSGNTVDGFSISADNGCQRDNTPTFCASYNSPDANVYVTGILCGPQTGMATTAFLFCSLPCTISGPCLGVVAGGNGSANYVGYFSQLFRWAGTFWTSQFSYSSLDGALPAPPTIYDDGSQYSGPV